MFSDQNLKKLQSKWRIMKPVDSLTIQNIKCINKNPGHYFCMGKYCQDKNIYMCINKECICGDSHKKCVRSQVQSILNVVKDNALSLKIIEEKINKMFDQLINKLSQKQNQLVTRFHDLFQLKLYSYLESQFLDSLQSNQKKQINGKVLFSINSNLYDRKQINSTVAQFQSDLKWKYQRLIDDVNNFGKQIQQKLLKLQGQSIAKYFEKSKIIKQTGRVNLVTFLPDLKKAELLYRGSQHGFGNDSFCKQCKRIQNLLFLVKTKQNNIIGSYSPISLPETQKDQFIEDPSKKSFIFSSTYKEKFQLKNAKQSIYNCRVNSQYLFGFGQDLMIASKANQNQKSITKLQSSYFHKSYTNNKDGYLRFTGSQKSTFGVDQIEVYKVYFDW